LKKLELAYNTVHGKCVHLNNISYKDLNNIKEHLENIYKQNNKFNIFDINALKKTLADWWIKCCFYSNLPLCEKLKIMKKINLFLFSVLIKKILGKLI
jgi:hypothetical protein